MELKQFISSALVDIVEGIHDAHEKLKNRQSIVSPALNPHDRLSSEGGTPRIERIEFDVAVVASESQAKSGGLGIDVLGARVGVDGDAGSAKESANRIKFSLPILLPQNAHGPLRKNS